ncbi:aminotransferase class V-fold PLP-dependent enzyme [Clostridium psychrophilum]|uniref:aminotransferase class V-fold PLP-dependent enzyme n=1 Tax=Clostridium psychrophilum TaxID=132926 RepID=UPI001C0CFD23|nr:aminotransferase class V-fold PLP-dependent enzyme [Clostridium psychrophilum]MBU3182193.1 aminotransferase class V-fold PLP-dependent enzyme [Clostridium psychrophilum]
MKTYPLESMTMEQAKKLQFKLIDTITKHFNGKDILTLGDLGVVMGINKPATTLKVEQTLADFFGVEKAVLLRGAGTGALRWGIVSMVKPGDTMLVHDAPIYPTTKVTLDSMGIKIVKANFNKEDEIKQILTRENIDAVLIQYTRQKINDQYDMEHVIKVIHDVRKDIQIITDDNYAVMKVRKTGAECGAQLSAFSLFKLLGPEGIGCLIGKGSYVDNVIKLNYSGGSQVQGHEAMDALRGLVYAPVQLAIQAEVNEELAMRFNNGEVKGVKNAFIANAQSKVLLIELETNTAKKVLVEAEKLGAAPNPVGAESKYEFVPMVYRVSGTFRAADPTLEERMIRINPMRSGADTIIRIVREAIERAR